jgi:hypothetical protein
MEMEWMSFVAFTGIKMETVAPRDSGNCRLIWRLFEEDEETLAIREIAHPAGRTGKWRGREVGKRWTSKWQMNAKDVAQQFLLGDGRQ